MPRKVAPDAVVVKPTPKRAAGTLDASHPMFGGRQVSPLHADGRVPVYTNMADFFKDYGHSAAGPAIGGICKTLELRARGSLNSADREFTGAVAWINDVLLGTKKEMGEGTWASVLSNRMDELLHDVVSRDDFLDESPVSVLCTEWRPVRALCCIDTFLSFTARRRRHPQVSYWHLSEC